MADRTEELLGALSQEQEAHKKTKIKLKSKERELHAITKSSSYKLALLLASSKRGVRHGMNYARELNPSRIKLLTTNRRHVRHMYAGASFTDAFLLSPNSKLAVVIHLYYIEMLPFFKQRLEVLSKTGVGYDLFITVPETKESQLHEVSKQLPTARIAVVPNCGRDVLPFVNVAKELYRLGYSTVLKMHSKKSPHRDDGQEWRDRIIDNLIPSSHEQAQLILETLNKKNTALIGPAEEYVSFIVNLSSTAHHLRAITSKVLNRKAADELITVADEYGFFGGTMFWARLDALMPILEAVETGDFEPELGQEDSTLAHALERLLNVIPELQGKIMYEIDSDDVRKIDAHTSNIPPWSEVSLDAD